MQDVDEIDIATREGRRRLRRARYRRRLMIVTVMVGLLLAATGALAAFMREGGSEEDHPVAETDRANSPRVLPGEKKEATASSSQKSRLLASETTATPAKRDGEPEDKPAPEEWLDVLVLGVDQRPGAAEGSTSHSDTMMLVRVSPRTGQIRLLSVPRDLLVEVQPGVEDRINTAYLEGGTRRAMAVMEDLSGITIDHYAVVDFEGFKDVIDAMGGVALKVGNPIRIGIEGQRVYIPPGRQKLDALEALAYARYRGTECGDLDRIRRQQRLIAALRDQALEWNTITELPGIVRVVYENVETNLGFVQAISVGRALVGHSEAGRMRSYQLRGEPEILPNGDAVLVPNEQANERILEKFRNDSRPNKSKRDPSSGC
jgi:polyisoprenyl-teichoic acid--peptidoglycan teichoic acid transferase